MQNFKDTEEVSSDCRRIRELYLEWNGECAAEVIKAVGLEVVLSATAFLRYISKVSTSRFCISLLIDILVGSFHNMSAIAQGLNLGLIIKEIKKEQRASKRVL